MPSLHTRRDFLRTTILGGAATVTLPAFIDRTFAALGSQADGALVQTPSGRDSTILVVLQLAGGNDGLNTVVPYRDDAYHRARPRLAIPSDRVLKLNDHVGLNPALENLAALFSEGHTAILQGVGYPNPNRSHFRSTEIWQTASDASRTERDGWLGRYFDNCCHGQNPSIGVSVSGQMPQAFSAEAPAGIVVKNPAQFRFAPDSTPESEFDGGSIGELSGGTHSTLTNFDYIERVALDAEVASEQVRQITSRRRDTVPYPASKLAQDLKLVAQLIAGGMPTRVYYVSLGGFDTHANQARVHDQLLGQLDAALGAFVADLRAQKNFDRVLVMSFSEFGRRVAENGSGGTDHGTAAPMFLLGGGVQPGLTGSSPSLVTLDAGDLRHGIDFRSAYATVLEKWLHAPSARILGRQFPVLPFL
jgi:uncharacterized protein (DUF1501 family)